MSRWAGNNNMVKYKKNCEEPSTSRKLEIDTLEHNCTLQTSKYESKKDSTLNVDMLDTNMIGQSNKTDTDTLKKISLDKILKDSKEMENYQTILMKH